MKSICIQLALLLNFVVLTQCQFVKTTIIITKTSPYCGGANPPEYILKAANEKKIPFGETFYIIKGEKNTKNRVLIDSFKFDSSGKHVALLKPNVYSVINMFNFKKLDLTSKDFDVNCLTKLWTTPLFTFKVLKGKSQVISFNITEPCPYNIPCMHNKIALPM